MFYIATATPLHQGKSHSQDSAIDDVNKHHTVIMEDAKEYDGFW
jgi:hypothetical protein